MCSMANICFRFFPREYLWVRRKRMYAHQRLFWHFFNTGNIWAVWWLLYQSCKMPTTTKCGNSRTDRIRKNAYSSIWLVVVYSTQADVSCLARTKTIKSRGKMKCQVKTHTRSCLITNTFYHQLHLIWVVCHTFAIRIACRMIKIWNYSCITDVCISLRFQETDIRQIFLKKCVWKNNDRFAKFTSIHIQYASFIFSKLIWICK